MSALAPLFLLGGLAIALPILFHLIRRQPRGHIPFSSLMFLEASPPRLSRRSRLDNWLLLLLRGLAVLLIAAAFSRPFLRSSAMTSTAPVARYVVLLVDRSASMRRGDLWPQAVDAAVAAAEAMRPTDRVAWAVFDSRVEVLKPFVGEGLQETGEDGRGIGADAIRTGLEGIGPTWRASDLGTALTTAADLIEGAAREQDAADVERTILLISDMQAGSSLAALRGYEWPEATRVRIVQIAGEPSSNAAIGVADSQVVPQSDGSEGPADGFRIGVRNAADSTEGQFSVRWVDAAGAPVGSAPASVTVPPGTMRVSRLDSPPPDAMAVALAGDDHAFDNRHFVAVPKPIEQTVLFVGSDVEDPRRSLLYYLQRVSLDRPGRTVSVQMNAAHEALGSRTPALEISPQRIPLIVVAAAPSPTVLADLQRYLSGGGRILMVIDSAAAKDVAVQQAVRALSDDPALRISGAKVDDYALMTRIDFSNALFEPLADPPFSDFAKIQFWAHQKVTVDESPAWKTLARFDDGDAALLERSIESGKLWILAAGWQPTESQLALSTKFVPIIAGMARDIQREEISADAVIGEAWAWPPSDTAQIVAPDGRQIAYRSDADARSIEAPGIYRYRDGEIDQTVAVNLPTEESQTEPMGRSVLEQLGVRFTDLQQVQREARAEHQLRDAELEKQQQWWRLLLLAGLAIIGLETLLSSHAKAADA